MSLNSSGLLDYQVPHFAHLANLLQTRRTCLDASDTGTGKTYTACALARQLGVVPIVCAPPAVLPSWERAAAHIGTGIELVGYEAARGRGKLRSEVNEDGEKIKTRIKYAESPWGIESKCGKGSMYQWKQSYAMHIFDEVHMCAGMTSLNSKMLKAAKRQSFYVLALSATAADRPIDMNALGFVLDLHSVPRIGRERPKVFMHWLLDHGYSPGIFGGFDFTDDPEEQKKFMQKLHHEIFPARGGRMRIQDIPGFPDTRLETKLLPYNEAAPDLSEDLAKLYWDYSKKEENALARGSALENLIRCRQKLEILKIPNTLELARIYAQSSKVIIFVNFVSTLCELCDGLLESFELSKIGCIVGEETFHNQHRDDAGFFQTRTRQETIDAFQKNEIDVLVATIGSGGVGISLQDPTGEVERTSLINPCYSAKQMKQVIGRPRRIGGAFSQQFFLYFKGSREERVAKLLETKLNNIDMLNDAELNGVL